MRRYGPSVDCTCCHAPWVSTEEARGYPCDCTWEWHCHHCGKCPVHCTGEISEREKRLAAACQRALDVLVLEGATNPVTVALLKEALKDRSWLPRKSEPSA